MAETRKMNPLAEFVQRQLGIIDNPDRGQEVRDMTGPAYRVQRALGLIEPEHDALRGVPEDAIYNLANGESGGLHFDWRFRGADLPPGGERRNVSTAQSGPIREAPAPGSGYERDSSLSQWFTPPEAPASRESPYRTSEESGYVDPWETVAEARTDLANSGRDAAGNPVADMYNKYLSQLDGMAGVYDNLARTNMEEIAQIFGETAGVASGAIAPMAGTYADAQGRVGGIYDNLDSRLGSIAGEMQGIAEGAAGNSAGDVATTSRAAIAPFEAASATARADTQANLEQKSNAGQNYLSNLASASVEEGKMHSSRVQAAADARAAEFDLRRMELEMTRDQTLMEIAMDSAGEAAEREAVAMLFGSAGIPIPEGINDLGTAAQYVNLGQDVGLIPTPGGKGSEPDELDQMMAQLSGEGQQVLENIVRLGENAFETAGGLDETGQPISGDRKQDFVFDLLAALDDQVSLAGAGQVGSELLGTFGIDTSSPDWLAEEQLIRDIIRAKYGDF